MNKEQFVNELSKIGIVVNADTLEKLNKFYHLLIEWNEKINLTTIVDEEEVYLKHFYDSLTLFKEYDFNNECSLCDVGSGAGFPGIVLKIVFPSIKMTLVDSLNKRVVYLNEIIKELELNDIIAIHSRMEDFSKINDKKFDIITARAVSNLNVLSEICVRALKIDGHMIFMKANCDEELIELNRICNKLSMKIFNVNKFVLPFENSNRTLVNIVKIGDINSKYPRNIDKIIKNPL